LSADVIVGLLTLLGLMYIAWLQSDLRRAETSSEDAEAITHITTSLIQSIEALSSREQLITELRARIESLEESDRLKAERIAELERKVRQLAEERDQLLVERARLTASATTLDEEQVGTST
jgi:chromosome segregation ATPase